MQQRHHDRKRYFEEQAQTCRKHYIPFLQKTIGRLPQKVLEVGCGEGGNLLPFAEAGGEVTGVDISATRIGQAREFFRERSARGRFIAADIFRLHGLRQEFPLILLHDVIEHIDRKEAFLAELKAFLAPGGRLFVAFPAWQMPFGGHQQIAQGKLASHLPYIHLLPRPLYQHLLRACGEPEATVAELLDIRRTRCSIKTFERCARRAGYRITARQLFLINPHYETKFGLRPRKLPRLLAALPCARDFFCTSCFYILKKES